DYYRNPEIIKERRQDKLAASPTDVELEVLAQTWSEHCKHKIFAARITYTDENGHVEEINSLYKTYIKKTTSELAEKRPDLLSVFKDNAGIVKFNDQYAYCMKVETHNSPSALDPYGGAMTGIVGVNRDIIGTGIGAKPIFNTDIFCFANPLYKKPLPPGLMHPQRIFQGVHKGIIDGGNESGIPTVNGAIVFENRFLGKPLVFCGTGGILPLKINDQPTHSKEIKNGYKIVMTGGRIGKDGIHGATFSSAALTETSPTSAVQIGDPITQKKMLDFLLEARDQGLYSAITDNGAGGLSSSVGEMATMCGGCSLHLDKAPLKYAGLYPWEILISEAQERMSLAVPPENIKALFALAAARDVEISELGEFNNSGFFTAFYKNQLVCKLQLDFMHNGLPTNHYQAQWQPPQHSEPEPSLVAGISLKKTIPALLARPNIASKEYWVRQYDHEVQGMSVVKPFDGPLQQSPGDSAVIKPLYNSYKGLVIANGIVPRYSDIDTYHMAANAVDEAVRNLVACGGDPDNISGLDNFC
ncbi:MAG TPA: AIR synthase related protein, partial [Spirochaetota bacterium]|nr:AIR synthase related protein [Spirochaetota bacterium]